VNVPGNLYHFALLDREQQTAVIRRLAAQGWPDHAIAMFTGRSVEDVRRVLAEPRPAMSESDAC